jgi:hypothetical protein
MFKKSVVTLGTEAGVYTKYVFTADLCGSGLARDAFKFIRATTVLAWIKPASWLTQVGQ